MRVGHEVADPWLCSSPAGLILWKAARSRDEAWPGLTHRASSPSELAGARLANRPVVSCTVSTFLAGLTLAQPRPAYLGRIRREVALGHTTEALGTKS